MKNLKLYKQQIAKIESLVTKMEQGELSVSELSELEELTRYLHEKSIILKYKAFEEKAQENTEEKVVDQIPVVEKEPIPEKKAEIDFSGFKEKKSSPVQEELPAEKQEKSASKNAGVESFLDKFTAADNSLSSKFEDAKIDTLVGAVGLNQKLRYINDLFDGSSELYGNAIKALDAESSLEDARVTLDELAVSNDWNPEEQTVIEFMELLNRRYA